MAIAALPANHCGNHQYKTEAEAAGSAQRVTGLEMVWRYLDQPARINAVPAQGAHWVVIALLSLCRLPRGTLFMAPVKEGVQATLCQED